MVIGKLNDSTLKWILAISLVVNIFLIGAAVGAGFVVKHHLRDFQRPIALSKAWRQATQGTTEAERHHIYLQLKAAALTGEPDMAKARALRAQAVAVAAKDPYDAAQIAVLSEQARSAENDARGKIENALILNMKGLPARERTFLTQTLLRASGRFDRFIEKDDKVPAAASSASSSSAVSQ